MRHLHRVLGQRFVVEVLGGVRIQAEVELVFPAEFEARLRDRVVADLRARMPLGEVGVVIAQNSTKRLQPRVMVIRDAAANPIYPQKLIDLSRSPKATADEPYRILGTLEFGSVPFDPEELFMK